VPVLATFFSVRRGRDPIFKFFMKTLFAGQMKRYNEKFGIKFIGWYNVAYGWDFDIRTFRAVFGETPHRYLQRRRVERSMFLLRETDRSVTDICLDVGFNSLGTFSRTFRQIVGQLLHLVALPGTGRGEQRNPDTLGTRAQRGGPRAVEVTTTSAPARDQVGRASG